MSEQPPPAPHRRDADGRLHRPRAKLALAACTLVVVGLGACTGQDGAAPDPPTPVVDDSGDGTVERDGTMAPADGPADVRTGAAAVLRGPVTRVADGDTLDVAGRTVRLAIADTPEVGEPCFGEATALTRSFVTGDVLVLRPADAPALDPYDRVLGEVVRASDGASLNVALVAAGLAVVDERFADEDPDLARRLRAAARGAPVPDCADAVTAGRSPGAVGDGAAGPASGVGAHAGRTDGGWPCHPAYRECLPDGPDLDCGEVGHRVVLLGADDPYRLDGNSTTATDGVGCETWDTWSAGRSYPYEG